MLLRNDESRLMDELRNLRFAVVALLIAVLALGGAVAYALHRADVAGCNAIESTHVGVVKLFKQLDQQTATSHQRTPAQKVATEKAYAAALADFPSCPPGRLDDPSK